jgi:IgA Peptidase M64/Peptidase M64 N-terminus
MMRTALTTIALFTFVSCGPTPGPRPPESTPVERTRRPPPERRATPTGPVKVTFARFFTDRTLRVDLTHRGSAKAESYKVVELVREGAWAGSRTQLQDPFPYGAHRFEVRDLATGALLFTRGYASLFSEWQTTREARKITKGFSESLRLPMPRAPFELRIHSRTPKGKLRRVFARRIDPRDKVRSHVRIPGVTTRVLHKSGPDHKRLDILILGDGYSQREREKFWRDAQRFAQVMLTDRTFGAQKGRINIRALYVASVDSGVSEPRKGRVLKTPLGLSFNTFGSARYMMTEKNLALRRAAAHAPYDALYLMGNTSRYGGGGIYNLYSTFPSDNEYDAYVFIHEFGHSFAGLADEYYTSETSTENMYKANVEPADPNITAFLGGRFKWKKLVKPGTPIPTPATAKYKHVVGLFEGAGYKAKGLFRAQQDCKMKGKGHVDFCRVCANAIAAMIRLYSE